MDEVDKENEMAKQLHFQIAQEASGLAQASEDGYDASNDAGPVLKKGFKKVWLCPVSQPGALRRWSKL